MPAGYCAALILPDEREIQNLTLYTLKTVYPSWQPILCALSNKNPVIRRAHMKPNIIFEDRDILVCVKPHGIPTQSRRVGTPDMVSILKNYLHTSCGKKGEPYLALIHRLDQPVEGLLVFAKNPSAAKSLSRQLQSSGFGKHYLAVLNGIPALQEATLEDYIVKDGRTNMSRICTPDTPGAKPARLHYKILRIPDTDNLALAEITLDTGRHHQIRVQMSHIGCPIAGDAKYTPASFHAVHPFSDTLQLYAAKLSFTHPATGAPLTFTYNPELPF